jgi:rhamnulose-1-phosphate aldolase
MSRGILAATIPKVNRGHHDHTTRSAIWILGTPVGVALSPSTAYPLTFAGVTSEFNSHLAVHDDQVARSGSNCQALIHAQPPHLVYLSHIPA